ncbi:MAG TPA: MFS transporter [Firmicutes bacterium]|nr:MFS transporter [Candidatus Fermentithermobacillaceae bacterium]
MLATEKKTQNGEKASIAAHNRKFFIADGMFFNLGSSFIDAHTVLPTYVSTLTSSPLLIGLASTIRGFGYLAPQIFVAGYIQRMPKKKPFMMATGHVMRLAAVGMALSALFANVDKRLALVIFYACLVLVALGDAFSGLPWMDLVARTIPAETRSSLFGTMQALGGISSFAAGFLTRYLLAMESSYPLNYALVMGLGSLGLYCSLGAMHFLKEPQAQEPARAVPMGEYLRRLPEAWRANPLFRRLMFVRVLLGSLYLALPFFAIHAQRDLGFPAATVGLFVSAQMVGNVIGGPVWGFVGDRKGAVWVIRAVASLVFGTGALALAARLAFFAGLKAIAYASYFLLYFILGGGFGGVWIGFTSYTMDIARPSTSATLVGLLNTIAGPLTLLTVVGGWLASRLGYAAVFAVEAAIALAGCLAAWRIPDSRDHRCPGES